MDASKRHFGMDWLRIGAFGLLILYHVAMVFAPCKDGLSHTPLFVPSVGHYAQGMLITVPITRDITSRQATAKDVHGILSDYYAGEKFVTTRPLGDKSWLERDRFLRADRLINTNSMELAVYGNDADGNVLAVASLDNLGKGASGAAVQCINLKTGVDETTGLTLA